MLRRIARGFPNCNCKDEIILWIQRLLWRLIITLHLHFFYKFPELNCHTSSSKNFEKPGTIKLFEPQMKGCVNTRSLLRLTTHNSFALRTNASYKSTNLRFSKNYITTKNMLLNSYPQICSSHQNLAWCPLVRLLCATFLHYILFLILKTSPFL